MKIVQRHRGWVSDESVRDIGEPLEMSPDGTGWSRNILQPDLPQARRPPYIMICDSVSCWIMGYESMPSTSLRVSGSARRDHCRQSVHAVAHRLLGACDHAPAMMIDDDLHRDLDPAKDGRSAGELQVDNAHGKAAYQEHPAGWAGPLGLAGLRTCRRIPGFRKAERMTPRTCHGRS